MKEMHLKKDALFEKGKVYSLCLRGARRYERGEFDLAIYTPTYQVKPKVIANIVSQKQFRFCDLQDVDRTDNYDETARTAEGLSLVMNRIYDDFCEMEIVTVLRFVVV